MSTSCAFMLNVRSIGSADARQLIVHADLSATEHLADWVRLAPEAALHMSSTSKEVGVGHGAFCGAVSFTDGTDGQLVYHGDWADGCPHLSITRWV